MKEEIKQTLQRLKLMERLKEIQGALQKLKVSLQAIREKANRNL